MDPRWAVQDLQVIRTLMERAALYRRALAPLMTLAGVAGLAGSVLGWYARVDSPRGFALYWMILGGVALGTCLLLVRRQAFQADEPFWSSPARRVSQALGPPFFAGFAAGCLAWWFADRGAFPPAHLAAVWMVCYGAGLHAAGFFMVRGMRLFGWTMMITGLVYGGFSLGIRAWAETESAHVAMGISFGAAQLLYGVYLYFSERNQDPG